LIANVAPPIAFLLEESPAVRPDRGDDVPGNLALGPLLAEDVLRAVLIDEGTEFFVSEMVVRATASSAEDVLVADITIRDEHLAAGHCWRRRRWCRIRTGVVASLRLI